MPKVIYTQCLNVAGSPSRVKRRYISIWDHKVWFHIWMEWQGLEVELHKLCESWGRLQTGECVPSYYSALAGWRHCRMWPQGSPIYWERTQIQICNEVWAIWNISLGSFQTSHQKFVMCYTTCSHAQSG